jgi:Cytochrome P460
VSCAFSKELLALHVENDLPEADGRLVAKHLQECAECLDFMEGLGRRQSQLKLLRCEPIPQSTLTRMRREVLSQIENSQQALGWSVRIERTLWLGFRRHAFVFSSLVIAAVSATLFAQMRQPALQDSAESTKQAVVFADNNTLVRPAGYREWISVGSSIGPDSPEPHGLSNASSGFSHNVYMDRAAYRAFSRTGKFPEGAVLILETSGDAGKQPLALQASVKDSRFDGGWGFFNFTDADGTIKDTAESVAGKSSCRTCHEERAKSDHVFTQFHPVLKTAT